MVSWRAICTFSPSPLTSCCLKAATPNFLVLDDLAMTFCSWSNSMLASEFCNVTCIHCSLPLSSAWQHPIFMVIVWRLRGNIIRTALCWVVWHNVHSQQHTYMSSSYRSSRLGLSHWDPYAMRRGGCLELYYCNMVEWCWWDSSLIWKTNWFPSVLWHCWFGHMTCKNRPRNDL